MAIGFQQVGAFLGIVGGPTVLSNPTSLSFGPDGKLYVAEQDGTINAFTVALQNGQYVATSHQVLTLPGGAGVVKSIMNHNDDGTNNPTVTNRQVTGMVVAGTAANPVLYISSSDPRIAKNKDSNLDTNSSTLTQVSWTGTSWQAVDLVRGLPRSEENHSVNGMVLSADASKLYLAVGGNTNNGAPSQYFANTGEYALSGTVLEFNLSDLQARPVLVDADGGQVGGAATARSFVYDLPTLDDPNVPNGGVRESISGLDVAGPFGGNDGLNMAVLPANAPLRIFADGFRNPYDLVFTSGGKLYTVDNGSNAGVGGFPIVVNGQPSNQINNGGSNDPEPLYLIQDGGYYGHANPARSFQSLSWTAFNDAGAPDATLATNTVANLSTRVPAALGIPSGFLIDPSRFTGNPTRLKQSGIPVPAGSPQSPALATIGSSSNGLTSYTNSSVFGGALAGSLLVAQFNGNITLLNLNDAGTALEPLLDPGPDGLLKTADDVVLASNGIYSLITGLGTPLDVIEGPGGTVWVAELGGDFIKVFSPATGPAVPDVDVDQDGLANTLDPFLRDRENGTGTTLLPGQTLRWDFDPNQDGNQPGPNGYGGGLTGVMVNGVTDYEAFFQAPSTLPDQVVNLDNVKFTTAAGGGSIVVEQVANGDALTNQNDGAFLFQTGLRVSPSTDQLRIRWSVMNPGTNLIGPNQQIGGTLGTGDQQNYLKIVATKDPRGEIQFLLEDNDQVVASSFLQADDLFAVAPELKPIDFELAVDVRLAVATPTISYETAAGIRRSVTGSPISLANTQVLQAILGNRPIQGMASGLALGLFASNTGQPASSTFQAVFSDLQISGASTSAGPALYRVNAGGPLLAASDGGPAWSADTSAAPSPYLLDAGSNTTAAFPALNPGFTLEGSVPGALFDSERWDAFGGTEMRYAFPVANGSYDVRLYLGNGSAGTSAIGQRTFDVNLEGTTPSLLNNIDLVSKFGHQVGGVLSTPVTVTDGVLNIDFLHQVQNPLVNGIEILKLGSQPAAVGAAILKITPGINNVQASNFPPNSFQITNTGGKTIQKVRLDVTNALYPDTVFDPFGLAGDSASKALTINTNGNTGVVTPSQVNYIGTGGTAGYEAIELAFDPIINGGFNSGETIGFSIDMDPNSIRGTLKTDLDAGSSPPWDVGGVSGSELIGSRFTVTFSDGSTATGQLMGDNSQAGAQALASQQSAAAAVSLKVNGLSPGGVGTYDRSGPLVTVQGPAGSTARVVLSKGFIQPVTPYAPFLANQLATLAASPFPANNAVEVQTVDVPLTGAVQNISSLFDVSKVANLDFAGEDTLPLGFIAALIDPSNGGLATGPVSTPIVLSFNEGAPPIPSISLAVSPASVTEDGTANLTYTFTRTGSTNASLNVNYTVGGTASIGSDYTGIPSAGAIKTVAFAAGSATATVIVDPTADTTVEPNETVALTLAAGSGYAIGTAGAVTGTITNDDGAPASQVLYRINAGGSAVAASDGGPNWLADTTTTPSAFLLDPGSNSTGAFPAVEPGPTVPAGTPGVIFDSERWDASGGTPMRYAFPVLNGTFDVRLYMGNGWSGTSGTGQRLFDVSLEGSVPANLNDIDLVSRFGNLVGGVVTTSVTVTDGELNIDFLHQVQNPLVSGIEIVQTGSQPPIPIPSISLAVSPASVTEDGTANLTYTFTRTGSTSAPLSVNYTVGGTASISSDYTGIPSAGAIKTVAFAAGSATATVIVDPTADTTVEPNETVALTLAAGSGYAIGTAGAVTGTITNDDGAPASQVLYRINAGGSAVAASDGGPNWLADTTTTPSAFLLDPGSNSTGAFPAVEPGPTVPAGTPGVIFDSERWDASGGTPMRYAFPVLNGTFDVRLYMGNGWSGTSGTGQRLFDVSLEGSVPANLNDIDLVSRFGNLVGGVVTTSVTVTDGELNIDFLHQVQNPLVSGIEIVQTGSQPPIPIPSISLAVSPASVTEDGTANLTYTFTRTGSTNASLNVNYTVGGTASIGSDYTGIPSAGAIKTVAFAAGSATATVIVDPTADTTVEPNETVALTLAAGSGYAIGTAGAVTGTITNDDGAPASQVLYRINAGGSAVAASDGGPNWLADTTTTPSAFLLDPGSNSTGAFPAVEPGPTVPAGTPGVIFDSERWDASGGTPMRYAFPVLNGTFDVRLYMGNGWSGTSGTGQRLFDVSLEGSVPANLNDIDLVSRFGNLVGGVVTTSVTVTDGELNIDFLHQVQNPLVSGIEIVQTGSQPPIPIPSISLAVSPASVAEDGTANLTYTFTRTGSTSAPLSVNYTVGGTASISSDYTGIPIAGAIKTVAFAAGSATATVIVDPTADTTVEPNETVALTLAAGSGYAIGTAGAVTGTITNDDGAPASQVLYRINAGGSAVAASDGGPNWLADTTTTPSAFLLDPGSNSTGAFPAVEPGPTVPAGTPGVIFDSERWDASGGTPMRYAFPVLNGTFDVRLYMGNGWSGTSGTGQRLFDVSLEGSVPANLNDIDLVSRFGNLVGGVVTTSVTVTDGELNIDFLHQVQNPLVSGIEIVQTGSQPLAFSRTAGLDLEFSGTSGNDILTGTSGNDTLTGGGGSDQLTGSAGVDTFRYTALSDSQLPATSRDWIRDLAIGTDVIDGPNAVSAAALVEAGAVASLSQSAIAAVLTTSSFVANGAATFSVGGLTYLALNDASAGFQSASDSIIEITGYSGSLTTLAII